MTRDQITEELLKETKEYCRSLPWVIDYACHDNGVYEEIEPGALQSIADPTIVKAKTLALVRDLLKSKRFQIGGLADDIGRVEPWNIPVEAVLERIDREWTKLGRRPNLGTELAWLGECTPETWPHGG